MDGDAREALRGFVRASLGADLDRLDTELRAELAAVRRQVALLERLAGLPANGPPRQAERRERAAEMRAQGVSLRGIAATLNSNRGTIAQDLRTLGVQPPAGGVVGLDGRTTRPRAGPPV